jgi:prepilin-type processing-associated H-X9-DG protein
VAARPPNSGWLPAPNYGHAGGGNVGLLDGSVTQCNRSALNDLLARGDDNGNLHFLDPK